MNDQYEFKVGDIVTFRAYHDQSIQAKVVALTETLSFQEPDVAYRLAGIKEPLLTITSGKSIVESRLFKEPPEKFKW